MSTLHDAQDLRAAEGAANARLDFEAGRIDRDEAIRRGVDVDEHEDGEQ